MIGLMPFQLDGQKYKRDWIRATLGIESKFDVGKFTLTLNSSTKGVDPTYWLGFNYTIAF